MPEYIAALFRDHQVPLGPLVPHGELGGVRPEHVEKLPALLRAQIDDELRKGRGVHEDSLPGVWVQRDQRVVAHHPPRAQRRGVLARRGVLGALPDLELVLGSEAVDPGLRRLVQLLPGVPHVAELRLPAARGRQSPPPPEARRYRAARAAAQRAPLRKHTTGKARYNNLMERR